MKSKPKDINDFISGGANAAAEAPASQQPTNTPASAPDDKITKAIRLSKSLDLIVKREAFERTQAQGRRVTESDLIDAALRQYLKL